MFEKLVKNSLWMVNWVFRSFSIAIIVGFGAWVTSALAEELAIDVEDTVQVLAPRVTVSEVIEAVGQKMQEDQGRIQSHEFTGLYTSIARASPGSGGGDYVLTESASRYRISLVNGIQQVRLWQRQRQYRNFELVSDETDEAVKRTWDEVGRSLIKAIPFTPESGDRYNYDVLDSRLVGNSLVYKIWFTPKSKFEALPSGTVWVDYSNWVIRKVDASMTGAVPVPLLVKDVPFYRITKDQVGDFWVDGETHTLARMRSLPLVSLPNNFEVRFVAVDHAINGSPAMVETVIDTSEFWLSSADAKKEMDTYWRGVDREFSYGLRRQFGCDDLMACGDLDSLAAVGSGELVEMVVGSDWEVSFHAVQEPGYNRVQGAVFTMGLDVAQVGPRRPAFSAGLGYGFGSNRPVWNLRAEIPLIAGSLGGFGGGGIQYTVLSVGARVSQGVVRFAGDRRLKDYERSFSAFVYGSDPNHYYEEKSVAVDFKWRAGRRLNFVLDGCYSRQNPMAVKTDWNLLGGLLSPGDNMQIDGQKIGTLGFGFNWSNGVLDLEGTWGVHHLWDSPFLERGDVGIAGGNVQYLTLLGTWDYLDSAGNRWILRGNYFALDEVAPNHMQMWYGDWGSLRGHEAGVLNGEIGQNVAFDLRLGFDLWESMRVPLLRRMGLQPHVFADYAVAKTRAEGGNISGVQGTRWDVGFGFGKLVGVEAAGGGMYLRVHAAVPVGGGSEGLGWKFLVGLGN